MTKDCARVGQPWHVATLLCALCAGGCGDARSNADSAVGVSSTGDGGTSNAGAASVGGNGSTTTSAAGGAVGAGGAGTGATTSTDGTTTEGGSGIGSATSTSTVGAGGAGGSGSEGDCEVNEDCSLYSDCCTCAAYPASGPAPDAGQCPELCTDSRCQGYSIDRAICVGGQCIIGTEYNCSPLFVACEDLSSECPEGTLPGARQSDCECVPTELCGMRPDCSSCADDEVCFRGFNDVLGLPYYCLPRPAACSEEEANCACAGQFCSALGFSNCTAADDGIMQCSP